MISLKHILVATDFGEASAAALTYGRALARRFGARISVMHVVEHAFSRSIALDVYIDESARKQLNSLLTDEERHDFGATAIVLKSNSPAFEIVTYAKGANIDLIVMGTHGRTGMEHLFIGSVAENVVRTAPCPVLTVHHPEREFVMPDTLESVAHSCL